MAGIVPNPTEDPRVAKVRRNALRVLGMAPVNRKEPLAVGTVLALAAKWSYFGAPLWKLTLAAFCMVAYAGFLRYSDGAIILVKDLKFHKCDEMEYIAIFISKCKKDQFREGSVVYICAGASHNAL